MEKGGFILLDGYTLTPEQLVRLGQGGLKLGLTELAWKRVKAGRQVVDSVLDRGQTAYGINTGFGNFANVTISPENLAKLQENLIRSHAAGVGQPLSPERTRMLLALRANVLAKGHSGIRPETLQQFLDAFNLSCLPHVPCQGTVGASGDLAPLAHLALGLMGEGLMWDPADGQYKAAKDVLTAHGLCPIVLGAKEGLALINGTQLITALGAEAVVRAQRIAAQADVVACLTLEALKGSVRAFHPYIHAARPHSGQQQVAHRMRCLLHSSSHPSEISQSHRNCGRVQDSYTLRCIPQVHGVVHDTIEFVRNIIATEMNSGTDNPMVFCDEDPLHDEDPSFNGYGDATHHHEIADSEYFNTHSAAEGQGSGFIISGGNFHGEYPAKSLDYLAIAIHEISSISERRIERLVNPALSGLPAFLTPDGGLNSGFMIAHCTAAALVSENKGLCHPSSVDSLSTSAAKEDHVSMGGYAARKALQVVEHVETVVAIELLAACQALEFLRPLKTTVALEDLHSLVRTCVAEWSGDRYMAPDIEQAKRLLRENKVWDTVRQHLTAFAPVQLPHAPASAAEEGV
eukprot:GILJ01003742.1.p1 GENE.GILJ01003742.1~~GILJ01003742.1.p1  ORF type:complete len:593 (+),score=100.38 GILJ01003742.1:59-1780(+)